MRSGSNDGTVTASRPPGLSTRSSSAIALMSSGMCSSTSAATILSKESSGNGRLSASPVTVRAEAPAGGSPSSSMAPNIVATAASSFSSRSNATTWAPRRYSSKACRPAPQPMSSTRSPGVMRNRSKSTVSRAVLLPCGAVALGDGVPVVTDRGPRDGGPGEPFLDAFVTGRAEAHPLLGRVVQPPERRGELLDVARLHEDGSVADDLGQRARTAGDERGTGGHVLDGRQREALVQGGDRGDLGAREQLAQLLVGDAGDEAHPVAEGQLGHELVGGAAGRGPADDDHVDVAFGGELGDRAQQRGDALEGGVRTGHRDDAAGDPLAARVEEGVVDTEWQDVHVFGQRAEVTDDVVLGRAGDGQDRPDARGDARLHPDEAVPAPLAEPLLQALGRLQLDAPVDADRVVDARHQRQAEARDAEVAVAEHLVVVHDVVGVTAPAQLTQDAEAEGQRLGEAARAHVGELQHVDPVAVLAESRRPERVLVGVQVKARDLAQRDLVAVELGVGLAGEDVDVVPEVDQLTRQMPEIDALAAAVRFAPIGEQCDAQRFVYLIHARPSVNASLSEVRP